MLGTGTPELLGTLCPRQAALTSAPRAPPRAMELAASWNLSEENASWPEPPTPDPPPFLGIGVENFITLVAFGLIFALGVLGNSLVITVLARSKPGKPRSTTNLFILNLSIADLAYLLFCIPFQATVYALPTWVLGAFICKFIHYFFTVSMLVSIFTLAAMSVDRYVAIVHSRRSASLRVSRNALLGVGCIWALSVAMASPVAYHQRLFHRGPGNQTFCWEQWPDQRHKKAYVVCTFVFGYLLPLLLICFCYAKVGAGGGGHFPEPPPLSLVPVSSAGFVGWASWRKLPGVWGTLGKFALCSQSCASPPGGCRQPRLSLGAQPTSGWREICTVLATQTGKACA